MHGCRRLERSESDWDKDEEIKCTTCASLHYPEYEKLSALSKGHMPSNWGWSLTPGGTISVVDARSQNGRQSALMAFARGREVHLQPFEQHGGLPLARWWRH